MWCDKPRTSAVFSFWLNKCWVFLFFFLGFTRKTADMCCAVTEPNKKARHFGWRHHQAGVLRVLDSLKTTFLNPEKFPFWKVLLSFDSNNRMFCFFFLLFTLECFLLLFFFFFTVAVQNLLNQEIHLSPRKINCYRRQHLPPIHRSGFRSALLPFLASGDVCFSSTAVKNWRSNICSGRWYI